jgi:hypothetical protein
LAAALMRYSGGNATHLLATSLTTARATARYIARLSAATGLPITFLPTESTTGDILRHEDTYCADYIEALIIEPETAADVLSDRITRLHTEGRFYHWSEDKDEDFPVEDLEKILNVDRFDFIMLGKRQEEAGFSYVELIKETSIA